MPTENRAKDAISLQINLRDEENVQIRIYNDIGQELYYDDLKELQGSVTKQISLNLFAEGIYLIKVQEGKNFYTKKFVKE